jgi:hypothetical protein
MAFKDYQTWRSEKEARVRNDARDWALAEAHENMTLGQLRSLSNFIAVVVNMASREAYDIGVTTGAETKK